MYTTWKNIHVHVYANNISLDGRDYIILTPLDLTFPDGSQEGVRQCVEVVIIDDEAVEGTESFYVDLTTSDARIELSRICRRAQITIFDNDSKTVLCHLPPVRLYTVTTGLFFLHVLNCYTEYTIFTTI